MSYQKSNLSTCGCSSDNNGTALPIYNQQGLATLRYRIGTHSSFKKEMLEAISVQDALTRLTIRYDDDLAIATLDAWATVLDVLTFYQERICNEGYLRTAIERLSVVYLAHHISYKPRPGLAAATYLAFSMNETPGAPTKASIPIGTKVQSIPKQNQSAQVFETVEEVEARVEWNNIKPQTKRKQIPGVGDVNIYLDGTQTGLQLGDRLLIVGAGHNYNSTDENWDFRRIIAITNNTNAGYTVLAVDRALGHTTNGKVIAEGPPLTVFAMRQKANLFGYNAPDIDVMASTSTPNLDSFRNMDVTPPEWNDFNILSIANQKQNTIRLDAIYPKIVKNSWLIMAMPEFIELYGVANAVDSAKAKFALASKTTEIRFEAAENLTKFDSHIRDTVIYAQSEELPIAELPITDFMGKQIILEKFTPGLFAGQSIILSGKRWRLQTLPTAGTVKFKGLDKGTPARDIIPGTSLTILGSPKESRGLIAWTVTDDSGFEGIITIDRTNVSIIPAEKNDVMVSEFHEIVSIDLVPDNTSLKRNTTRITLEESIFNYFDIQTLTINANVAAATHGETKQETPGSGNGSQVFQKFQLKQKPLTFISEANASGAQTTLEVRVNDIKWKEVPSFYGIPGRDKVFTTTTDDDGTVNVLFGDGITGARLPTGTENIKAKYRTGIGLDGQLEAGQLAMLVAPQLGVSKVSNPLDTSGAQDPETMDSAKQNAPLTVLTLDRLVSAKDFENFTRAFAGISKARADIIWNGEIEIVSVTVALADGTKIVSTPLYTNLRGAFDRIGHNNCEINVVDYKLHPFTLNAGIQIDDSYLFEEVQQNVVGALVEKFSFDSMNFGQDVTPAQVIIAMQEVEGVVYADLNQLDEKDPFAIDNYRLTAAISTVKANSIQPAELLVINIDSSNITQLLP